MELPFLGLIKSMMLLSRLSVGSVMSPWKRLTSDSAPSAKLTRKNRRKNANLKTVKNISWSRVNSVIIVAIAKMIESLKTIPVNIQDFYSKLSEKVKFITIKFIQIYLFKTPLFEYKRYFLIET